MSFILSIEWGLLPDLLPEGDVWYGGVSGLGVGVWSGRVWSEMATAVVGMHPTGMHSC